MILRAPEKWFCKLDFFSGWRKVVLQTRVCRTTFLPPSKSILRVQIKRLSGNSAVILTGGVGRWWGLFFNSYWLYMIKRSVPSTTTACEDYSLLQKKHTWLSIYLGFKRCQNKYIPPQRSSSTNKCFVVITTGFTIMGILYTFWYKNFGPGSHETHWQRRRRTN